MLRGCWRGWVARDLVIFWTADHVSKLEVEKKRMVEMLGNLASTERSGVVKWELEVKYQGKTGKSTERKFEFFLQFCNLLNFFSCQNKWKYKIERKVETSSSNRECSLFLFWISTCFLCSHLTYSSFPLPVLSHQRAHTNWKFPDFIHLRCLLFTPCSPCEAWIAFPEP